MENFKNIITLLNNTDTMELGATLAVSQGLEEKILAFYKLKRSRQNYKKRMFISKIKTSYIINAYSLEVDYLKKLQTKRANIKNRVARKRIKFTDVILAIHNFSLNSLNA